MIMSIKPKESTVFQNVLSPGVSALLVIDHQAAFASCFDTNGVSLAEQAVSILIGAANKLEVPVLASVVETNRIVPDLSQLIEGSSGKVQLFGRNVTNPWEDLTFATAVETANRPKLLLAGLSAECSLSVTALCALEQGFEVYVVRDACLGFSTETLEASLGRLKQAGAVIVSWRQVIMEWHQGTVDITLIRRVLKQRGA